MLGKDLDSMVVGHRFAMKMLVDSVSKLVRISGG